jgi:hypothetical protein
MKNIITKGLLAGVLTIVTAFSQTSAQTVAHVATLTANWSSTNFPFTRQTFPGGTNSPGRTLVIQPQATITLTTNVGNTASTLDTANSFDTIWVYGTLKLQSNQLYISNYTVGTTQYYGVIRIMPGGTLSGATAGKVRYGASTTYTFGAANNWSKTVAVGGTPIQSVVSSANSVNARFQTFTPFVTLPVDLGSFTVETNNEGHNVSWIAYGESNRNEFILETSVNGVDFTYETTIQGTSEMVSQQYNHMMAKKTGAFFVRISERNITGTVNVLATKYVSNSVGEINEIKVFPTLVSTNKFNVIATEAGEYQIQIMNANMVEQLNVKQNVETENQMIQLENINLSAGTYFVVVTGANNIRKTEKIIITQ